MSIPLKLQAVTGDDFVQTPFQGEVVDVPNIFDEHVQLAHLSMKLANSNSKVKIEGNLNVLASLPLTYAYPGFSIVLGVEIYRGTEEDTLVTYVLDSLLDIQVYVTGESPLNIDTAKLVPILFYDTPFIPRCQDTVDYYIKAYYTTTEGLEGDLKIGIYQSAFEISEKTQ